MILPEDYVGLVEANDYEIFLNKCLTILSSLGYKILSFEDGDIVYEKDESEEGHFYLDNVLRKYLQADEDEQDAEIVVHFTKLKDQSKAYDYLYKDFDYAKQFFKVLVKADDVLPNSKDFVHQEHLPKLFTFLVLDFEDQFHYVGKAKADQWEVNEQELFTIALNNVRQEEVEVRRIGFDEKYDVFALFSGDFSASYSLLMEQELDFAIGRFGSLIALPTKGSAFLYPIESDEVLDVIVAIYPTIEQFFEEDPGSITLDFYWYYQGKYEVFEKVQNKDGSITISNPGKLMELLSE